MNFQDSFEITVSKSSLLLLYCPLRRWDAYQWPPTSLITNIHVHVRGSPIILENQYQWSPTSLRTHIRGYPYLREPIGLSMVTHMFENSYSSLPCGVRKGVTVGVNNISFFDLDLTEDLLVYDDHYRSEYLISCVERSLGGSGRGGGRQ